MQVIMFFIIFKDKYTKLKFPHKRIQKRKKPESMEEKCVTEKSTKVLHHLSIKQFVYLSEK